MQKRALFLFVLAALCRFSAQAQDARSIVNKIYVSLSQIKQYSFEMHSKERFGEHYLDKKMKFNINESPLKVYMKDLDSGVELLYVNGWNDNKAFINPNGFPWVNVSLKIDDPNVIKETHHFVTESGLGFTGQLMRQTEQKIKEKGEKFEDYFSYAGEVDWNGMKCYKLIIKKKDFQYVPYTVTKDEPLRDLCARLIIPEYMVAVKNKIPHGGNVKTGKELNIPNAFGKEVVLYVDKNLYLPVVQMVFDEKGLYEMYEFRSLKTTPAFHADEFDSECSCYGF